MIYEAYRPIGAWAIVVFALPLFLMRKTQEAYLKHTAALGAQAARRRRDDPVAERLARAGEQAAQGALDRGDGVAVGDGRRARRLHGRPLAPRAAARARDRRGSSSLSHAELELLGHAALFHDIGKLGIPDSILLKPASLTEEEWAIMASHAEEGASIINRLGFLSDAVPAIRHHHERFDGQGYPDGLAGEDIPLGARIIHVADAFDSMLTTRVYRPARPAHEALAELAAHGRIPVLPALRRPRSRRSCATEIGHEPAPAAREPQLVD